MGGHLCRRLLESGHAVTALLHGPRPAGTLPDHPDMRCWRGDITRPETLREATRGAEVVFHLAAMVSDWGPPGAFLAVNRDGTANVLSEAGAAGVRRVVHLSTAAVYGFPGGRCIVEEAPLVPPPWDHYSTSKALAETLALESHRAGLETTVLRPATVYGPGDRTTLLKLAAFLERGLFCHVDQGRRLMSPLYIDNLLDALEAAALSPEAPGRIYNLADDGVTTWSDFIGCLCAELGCPPPRRSVPAGLAGVAAAAVEGLGRLAGRRSPPTITRFRVRAVSRDLGLDCRRARRDLGFAPRVSTRQGLTRGAAWLRGLSRERGRGQPCRH